MARSPSFSTVQRQIGRRIRAARANAGLTQEEAAAKAGIDYKRWQRVEAGEVNATIRTLNRVATTLGITLWELCGPDVE